MTAPSAYSRNAGGTSSFDRSKLVSCGNSKGLKNLVCVSVMALLLSLCWLFHCLATEQASHRIYSPELLRCNIRYCIAAFTGVLSLIYNEHLLYRTQI